MRPITLKSSFLLLILILIFSTYSFVRNTTTFGNLTVHITNSVLDIPGDVSDAAFANNLTGLVSGLNQTQLLSSVNYTHGITIFAPSESAVAAAQQALSSAGYNTSNTTLLANILQNHVINGTSIYSGDLLGLNGTNETTAAGESLSASSNSTGTYVTVGNVTAKIVQPDIILWNGVMHIIDTVLVNVESNPSAASSA